LATRLWPLTENLPKALVPVAGKPFAGWQLEWLASEGVDEIVYSIGHLGDAIRTYVGDGAAWNVRVRYVDEGQVRRGTAGAIRLASDIGVLDESFFVVYGDSYLTVGLKAVERAFQDGGRPGLMTVFRNEGRWDRSNAVFDGQRVLRYDKTIPDPPSEMCWIDYGLLGFSRAIIVDRVPPGVSADLSDLCADLSREGLMTGYEATERFFEIGSADGLRELDEVLTRRRLGSIEARDA